MQISIEIVMKFAAFQSVRMNRTLFRIVYRYTKFPSIFPFSATSDPTTVSVLFLILLCITVTVQIGGDLGRLFKNT